MIFLRSFKNVGPACVAMATELRKQKEKFFTISPTSQCAKWLRVRSHNVTSLPADSCVPVRLSANHWRYQLLSQSCAAQIWCLWILLWRLMAAIITAMNCYWNDCCQWSVASAEIHLSSSRNAHCARDSSAFLAHETPQFIVPELWPSNSLDLNLVDYRVWGVIQERVYLTPIQDADDLKQCFVMAWSGLQHSVSHWRGHWPVVNTAIGLCESKSA